MAERQPNFLTDTLLPLYAFVSGASGNRGAAQGAAGLARILKQHTGRTGAGRQAGDPVENAFAEARTRQPIQTQSGMQQFREQRLGEVLGLLEEPMTTGDPLTDGVQGPEGPRAPTSRERGERLGTLPPGLLTAAGLGKTEKAIASREVDPRQFALDQRNLLGVVKQFSPDQLSPENRKQAIAMIGRAKDQAGLSDAFVKTMHLAGADPGSPEEQAFREGRNSGLTAVQSMAQMAKANRQGGGYGFGNQVDAAIFARYGEELQGNEPTPAMVAQAQRDVQEGKVQISREKGAVAGERQAAATRAKLEATRAFREDQPLFEAEQEKSRQFFFRDNATSVPQSMSMAEVRKGIETGRILRTNDREAKAIQGLRQTTPLLQGIKQDLEKLYGSGGIFENLQPGVFDRLVAGGESAIAQATQSNPELVTTIRSIQANVDLIRRQLQGQVGTQTERDAERGLLAMPNLSRVPDTKDVAFGTFNSLLEVVNGAAAGILDNTGFAMPGLSPLGTDRQPTPAAPQDNPAQATMRQQLRDTGMTDEEIDQAIGRTTN